MAERAEVLVAPRINCAQMGERIGQLARFMGKVLKKTPQQLILLSPDSEEVTVTMIAARFGEPTTAYVEVGGRVVREREMVLDSPGHFMFAVSDHADLELLNKIINASVHPQMRALWAPAKFEV